MTVNKICSVYNLKLHENDTRVIFQNYLLSDDVQIISQYLSSPVFINLIGKYSYKNFYNNTHFFSSGTFNKTGDLLEISNKEVSCLQELVNFL
jgi:hypothetical protein